MLKMRLPMIGLPCNNSDLDLTIEVLCCAVTDVHCFMRARVWGLFHMFFFNMFYVFYYFHVQVCVCSVFYPAARQ